MTEFTARLRSYFWAETDVLVALRRQFHWIVFTTVMSGIVGYLFATAKTERFEVVTEIMVPHDYQYTSLPTHSGSEQMQVRVDHPTALNNDIRIIASAPVRQHARDMEPYPRAEDVETGRVAPEANIDLSISLIEGSSVMRVAVTDPDPAWAKRYLTALTTAYQQARKSTFSLEAQNKALSDLKQAALNDLAAIDAERFHIATETQFKLDSLTPSARTGMDDTVLAPYRAELKVLITQFTELSGFENIARPIPPSVDATAPGAAPDPVIPPAPESAGLTAATAVESLEALLAKATQLAETRDLALANLDGINQALGRLALRDAVTRHVSVITPPTASSSPVGLSLKTTVIISFIMGFILSALATLLLSAIMRSKP